jgi:hypothetical protein
VTFRCGPPQLDLAAVPLGRPVAVLSARVNHERSRQWDIKSRSWITLASLVLGDRTAMEKQAMRQAQRLVERAARTEHLTPPGSARTGPSPSIVSLASRSHRPSHR